MQDRHLFSLGVLHKPGEAAEKRRDAQPNNDRNDDPDMLIEVRIRLRETHLDCTAWRWPLRAYWRRIEGVRWRPSGAGLSGTSGGPSLSPSGVATVSGSLSSGVSGESRGSGLGSRFETAISPPRTRGVGRFETLHRGQENLRLQQADRYRSLGANRRCDGRR